MNIFTFRPVLIIAVTLGVFCTTAAAQIPGPVVNVVANDPFNQKQVEVQGAANPNNPNHIFTGFIDYQTVINEDPLLSPTSSAWCGYSFSINGGKTWNNALIPAWPGDTSPEGTSSPIYGSTKCADPVVTWDTSGHAFFMGLAQHPIGVNFLFLSRFTDPDDGTGRLLYDFTTIVDSGNPSSVGQDLDKPSILFVPDPTPGSQPDAGVLYACGTIFSGSAKQGTKVICKITADGGETLSQLNRPNQTKVNGNVSMSNGTAMAPSTNANGTPDGGVYLFWRSFEKSTNGYWFVKIDRSGNANGPSQAVGGAGFFPYDVPTGSELARSNAFPSVATDASGRILLVFQAYSAPGGAMMAAPSPDNTPRIFLTYSTNQGGSWAVPRAVDYGPHVNTFQFMPWIAVSGDAFQILYYDARNDGRPINFINGAVYFPWGRDRRFDVRVVQGKFDSSGEPEYDLPSAQVSKYITDQDGQVEDRAGCTTGLGTCPAVLMPHLPIAAGGTVPFIGDYNSLAPAVPLVRNDRSSNPNLPAWRFTNQEGDPETFLAFFVSTQDVGFPAGGINGDWTLFNPVSCQNPKSRDANVYFSAISTGIAASWSGTSRNVVSIQDGPIPPQFIVTVENRSGEDGFYRLKILDNPPTEDWSFVQTPLDAQVLPDDVNSVDTKILRNSSVSLPVYYRLLHPASPSAPVEVLVQQLTITLDSNGEVVVNEEGLQTVLVYSLQIDNLQLDNLQLDNLQIDNLQLDNLQLDNLQLDNLQLDNLQLDNGAPNLQIDNLQIDNLQLDNMVPDQDITFTVSNNGLTPTPGYSITNLLQGETWLTAGYDFQLLIYRKQTNPPVCSDTEPVATDVLISNLAITEPSVEGGQQNLQIDNLQLDNLQLDNLQLDNLQLDNLQLDNSPIEQTSNATFVVYPGEEVYVTLRTYIPAVGEGSPSLPSLQSLFDEGDVDAVGQATFATAANPDGDYSASFFDTTPPVITAICIVEGVSAACQEEVWYGTVTLEWSVSDPQSGIASTDGCGPMILPNEDYPEGGTFTCSATNNAGLPNSVSVTIQIDTTPPTVTVSFPNPVYGLNSWFNADDLVPVQGTVTANDPAKVASISCSDGETKLAIGNLTGIDTPTASGTLSVSGDGTHDITCMAVDGLGNDGAAPGSANVAQLKIDTTAPTINILAPADGRSYVLNDMVPASYACSDSEPGSGIDSCSGPVGNGTNFDTVTVGSHEFTVTATDLAGNDAISVTHTYLVVYNFALQPPKSPAQLGSAVPLTWQLTNANGQIFSDLNSLVSLTSYFNGTKPCKPSSIGESVLLFSPATGATGGSDFRFIDPSFKFNWNTTSANTPTQGPGCYTIAFQLDDGSDLKLTTVELK